MVFYMDFLLYHICSCYLSDKIGSTAQVDISHLKSTHKWLTTSTNTIYACSSSIILLSNKQLNKLYQDLLRWQSYLAVYRGINFICLESEDDGNPAHNHININDCKF
jgi:hypothetical protein